MGFRLDYYRKVWQEARSKANQYIRKEWGKFIVEETVLLGSFWGALFYTGQSFALASLYALFLAIIIVPLVHFGWNLISVPADWNRQSNAKARALSDSIRLEIDRQVLSLSKSEQSVILQIINMDGMNEHHIRKYAQARGFDPPHMGGVSDKTTFMTHDFEGQWRVKPEFAVYLQTKLCELTLATIEITVTKPPNQASQLWLELLHIQVAPFPGEPPETVIAWANLDDTVYELRWRGDQGPVEERTIRAERPGFLPVVVRSQKGATVLGTPVRAEICYLTEANFQIHHVPSVQINTGVHRLYIMTRTRDKKENMREFRLIVPPIYSEPLRLEPV